MGWVGVILRLRIYRVTLAEKQQRLEIVRTKMDSVLENGAKIDVLQMNLMPVLLFPTLRSVA